MSERARTDKGEARRTSILTAAADLALARGLGAVSHRAVAERAGVPLAATTYYFTSRDDLVAGGLATASALDLDRARAAAGRRPPRRRDPSVALAVQLVDVVLGLERARDSGLVRAYYERCLAAGRSPAVAAVVKDWQRQLVKLVGDVLTDAEQRAASGGADRPVPAGGTKRRATRTGEPIPARTAMALLDGFAVAHLGEGDLDVESLIRELAAAFRALSMARH
jgi:DNA-binding transcriptional regulator YbjK